MECTRAEILRRAKTARAKFALRNIYVVESALKSLVAADFLHIVEKVESESRCTNDRVTTP